MLPAAHYCTQCGRAVEAVPAFAAAASPIAADPAQEPLPAYPAGRFVAVHLLSLGLFTVPWAYRLWKYVDRRQGTKRNAGLRAVFTGFVLYDLMQKLGAIAAEDGVPMRWNAPVLAILLFAIGATSRLPGQWNLISLLGFVPLVAVQLELNRGAREAAGGAAPEMPPMRLGEWLSIGLIWAFLFFVFITTFIDTIQRSK